MKILLLGEYSNVHTTLAKGLRALGHEVFFASAGDFFKNYPSDMDLSRTYSKTGGMQLMVKLLWNRHRFVGFDIVQIINPMFLELKAERVFQAYKYLRKHNRKMVLGAFGMDYYWVHENITRKPLRYSDFNIGSELRYNKDAMKERKDWLDTAKGRLNQQIAADCDAIVAGLYEYYVCYEPLFPDKTEFIPFPIEVKPEFEKKDFVQGEKIKLFIGINRMRSEYKGTDKLLSAAQKLQSVYPDRVDLRVVENVPFAEYTKLLTGSDVILDQIYSYTPSMNPLEAMSRGIICVGGGEEEHYHLLGEEELRPIVNVLPFEDDIYRTLCRLVEESYRIPKLKRQSLEYIRRHHDHIKVAKRYVALYEHLFS